MKNREKLVDILLTPSREVLFIVGLSREIRELKREIDRLLSNLDYEFLELSEVFSNLKRVAHAKSLLDNREFLDKLGIKLLVEYHYQLDSLDQSEKMMFNYALEGRRKMKGIIHELNGMKLARSLVLIPKENAEEFENFLNAWKVKYKKRLVIYEEV